MAQGMCVATPLTACLGPSLRRQVMFCDGSYAGTGGMKLAIALEVGVDGATVSSVAQRHELTPQQIYTWRREMRLKGILLQARGAVLLLLESASIQAAPLS